MWFLCMTVTRYLPSSSQRVKGGLPPVLTHSPHIFSNRSAFVSLQEMTNASAAVTADSSRIKFNRLILIPFFLSFTKFHSLHAV